MPATDDLAEVEHEGWRALSTDGETARAYYDEVLDDEPVMLLPGGLVMSDREQLLAAMSGAPWASFRLDDLRVAEPVDGTGVVTYSVVASREGQPEYAALVASVYVRRTGGWRLVLHQQTPQPTD